MSKVDPARYLRGLLGSVEHSDGQRLPSSAASKLPSDTVGAGRVPAGVHVAFTGDAAAIDVVYEPRASTSVPSPAVDSGFAVWVGSHPVGWIPVESNSTVAHISLPSRPVDEVVRIYLPETPLIALTQLEAESGNIVALPPEPIWVVYGDSITQGWSVSTPGRAWPSLIAHELNLEVVNLGFAGSARGETPAAIAMSESGADLVTLAWGTNTWSSIPTDPEQLSHAVRIFLTIVRQGLPTTPIVVVSPIVRPDAEQRRNKLGATLRELRTAMEAAVADFVATNNDDSIYSVDGLGLVTGDALVDGVHPGDEGHRAFADALLPIIAEARTRISP
ncbi:MAG: SGNH/GDSL hydrolase family protein [Rhodococcus fascians]